LNLVKTFNEILERLDKVEKALLNYALEENKTKEEILALRQEISQKICKPCNVKKPINKK